MASSRRPPLPVHPRVCGERVGHPAVGVHRDRFIPACAGNAFAGQASHVDAPVHPRVCGEREVLGHSPGEVDGSSPRVRGTLRERVWRGGPARFIPACAGNAWPPARCRRPLPVHPRVCGERRAVADDAVGEDGSSPRVRGTRTAAAVATSIARFIPACAGNAAGTGVAWRPGPVHPRVCGERALSLSLTPPPALSVHPRVCGERLAAASWTPARYGSSPRVRGTHKASYRQP